ncbi:sensor histidine kinase [Deinococcus aquaticus]|uniref:sensor histidine kinase n=1 Tax=Deinococcus aquaticus TaxID=328692 RepID=UPI003608291A
MQVTDNGIGVPAEYHERIFTVFQRLHVREAYAGNGIGLSIARRVAERHGGNLWITSTPGQGSTFHFTLPAPSETESG